LILLLACHGSALDDSALQGDAGSYRPGTETDGGYDGPLTFTGDRPYNVLMFSIDTFRPENVCFFGGSATTPELDALLGDAVVLGDHRSCSNWTFASVLCLQGGGREVDLGFVPQASNEPLAEALVPVPDSLQLAPELLRDAGWSTRLFTTNAFFDPRYGTTQGFDTVSELNQHGGEGSADDVADAALLALTSTTEEPWYLHAHFMDPHQGWDPPEEYLYGLEDLEPIDWSFEAGQDLDQLLAAWDDLSDEERALIREHMDVHYGGELSWVSSAIERVLDGARSMGRLDNTLVVLWSDHGEELAEHGEIGHHQNLYDETNRAFVAYWAEGLEAQAYGGRTTHAEVWPTILQVLPHDFGAPLPGAALGAEEHALRFGQKLLDDHSSAFVEDGEHKLLVWATGDAELYDLQADPAEQTNLVEQLPETAVELWAGLELYIAELEALSDVTWVHPAAIP